MLAATLAEIKGRVLVDMEASLEHMRRGTVRHLDHLLVVTEPYYRSLESAGRLLRLALELGIPRVGVLANKVRSAGEEEAIRTYLEGQDVPLVAVIPFDDAVTEVDLHGRALIDGRPEARVVRALEEIVVDLWEEPSRT